MKTLLVEDDRMLRILAVLVDPKTDSQRIQAFTDFISTDVPDFNEWCAQLRSRIQPLYPAKVILVSDQEQFHAALPHADAAIIESLAYGIDQIELNPKLKCVQQFGTVLKNIDQKACKAAGIEVLSLRRHTNMAMAEHTLMLCMVLARKFNYTSQCLTEKDLREVGKPYRPYDRRHTPAPNYGRIGGLKTLHGMTLGLLGFGEIAREVALRANAFGMQVLTHQRTPLEQTEIKNHGIRQVSFETLLAQSDFLSIHVPYSELTHHLINHSALMQMKPGSFLINTARAHIVEHDALVQALKNQHLAGAAFDVHYSEPMSEQETLKEIESFIATPHVGGASRMNGLKDAQSILEQCARHI